jgi:hypothetical protein
MFVSEFAAVFCAQLLIELFMYRLRVTIFGALDN